MSVFNPTSVLNQIHANIATITTASPGKFTRSPYRFTLDREPDSGPDGMYSIDLTSADAYSRKWGTGENICTARVAVRVAYFRGGGNKGGGDRFTVMRVAADDCQLIADVIENPDNYNASASGISVVVFEGYSRVGDLPKAEIWECRFTVQWRSDLQTSPVQDLMVASLISATTTALSAMNVLSLESGTGAVIQPTAVDGPRLFFLDRENLAGDTADGDSILNATGITGAVWREQVGGAGFAEDMTLALPNAINVDVNALRLRTDLTTQTSGAEVSRLRFDLLTGGPLTATTGLTVDGNGIEVPIGSVGAPSVAIGDPAVGLSYNSAGPYVRMSVGGRAYYWYSNVFSLDPGSASGGFWCDPAVTNAFTSNTTMTGGTGAVMRGGGVDRIFCNAVGMSFNNVTTPVAKGTISGTTAGTLGQLQTVVKALLVYLASRGDITDSTT